jgi:hypothetical protein
MTATFKSQLTMIESSAPDAMLPFFRWLAIHRSDERTTSLLTLIAAHDIEPSANERANIRRSVAEIMENPL